MSGEVKVNVALESLWILTLRTLDHKIEIPGRWPYPTAFSQMNMTAVNLNALDKTGPVVLHAGQHWTEGNRLIEIHDEPGIFFSGQRMISRQKPEP